MRDDIMKMNTYALFGHYAKLNDTVNVLGKFLDQLRDAEKIGITKIEIRTIKENRFYDAEFKLHEELNSDLHNTLIMAVMNRERDGCLEEMMAVEKQLYHSLHKIHGPKEEDHE